MSDVSPAPGSSARDPLRRGHSWGMTNPDPSSTPGLEAGGSVTPGDTPPIESSTSGLTGDSQHTPEKRGLAVPFGAIVVILVVVALIVIGIGGKMAGFFG